MIMRFLLSFPLLAAPALTLAGPFVELGVGANMGAGCIHEYTYIRAQAGRLYFHPECSDDPLGFITVGYRVPGTGLHFQLDHTSSLPDRGDYGLNTVSIRYRWEGKD